MKEVDALDGVCALASDQSGIQYKMLNRSKGPAVWGPRAQIDRLLYKEFVQKFLLATPNLTIQTGSVENLLLSQDGSNAIEVEGVVMKNGRKIKASSVVITTGTFLRGQINIGLDVLAAGRIGDEPAVGLAETLSRIGFMLGRLKTGTPPRLVKSSIDYRHLTPYSGDELPVPFSFLNERVWINPENQVNFSSLPF